MAWEISLRSTPTHRSQQPKPVSSLLLIVLYDRAKVLEKFDFE